MALAIETTPQALQILETRANRHKRIFERLETQKSYYQPTWDDIVKFILPTNEHFGWRDDYRELAARVEQRAADNVRVVDSTARIACQQLTSFIYTGITNPSNRWFELALQFPKREKIDARGRTRVEDYSQRQEVQDYLKAASDMVYKAFQSPKTRFETANYECIQSVVGLGTGCLYVSHVPGSPVSFQAVPLSQLYISEDAYGHVDTVYRKFFYTARQAAQRFGKDKLGPKLAAKLDTEPFEEVPFLHIVYPSDESGFGARAPFGHKFYSCYQCLTDNKILAESGFEDMPYIVVRYMKNTGEVYGVSQSNQALPDVRMIQRMHWAHLRMEEKMANPVTLLSSNSDVKMNQRAGATVIGGLDSLGRPTVQQLNISGDMNAALAMEEIVRGRIKAAFFMDRLAQIDDPRSTATEARIRQMEQIRQLAPANTRLEHEYAGPLVQRVYKLLKKAGELPAMPEILKDHDFVVEYSGPMSQAQRLVGADILNQFIANITPAMQINPEVAKEFDWAAGARGVAALYPLFPGFVLDKKTVNKQTVTEQQAETQANQSVALEKGLDQAAKIVDIGAQLEEMNALQ